MVSNPTAIHCASSAFGTRSQSHNLLLPALAVAFLAVRLWAQPALDELIRQAQNAIQTAARNDRDAAAARWASRLWDFRLQHAGTPEALQATAEALRLLALTGQYSELLNKAKLLSADDPAWVPVLDILIEAAQAGGDSYFLVSRAKRLIASSARPEIKLQAQWALGRAYWGRGEIEKAKTAFRTVMRDAGDSALGKTAEAFIREIETLSVGQPAPPFQARQINGDLISLSDFRGRVLLLDFWATWCAPCKEDRPLIQRAFAKYRDQGFAVVGVSLDDERGTVAGYLSRDSQNNWPQIVDGPLGPIATLFHVNKIPANYLIDRSGRITAKRIPVASLDGVIALTLNKH